MSHADNFEVLRRFDEDYIPFPPFVQALEAIETNLAFYRATGIAQHALVLGESGSGKTSLCNWIHQKYPRFELAEQTVVPALIVPVPPAATISGMAEAMLAALRDPFPGFGTATSKTSRVAKVCRSCRVEIVLIDEAAHLYDRGQATTHYMVADWLKALIDQLAVPTVFLGLPRLEQLLQVNEQLRRRFSRCLRLNLGQSDTNSIHDECLQLFISLGACTPLQIRSGAYGWEEMGMRLYYASDGRVAYLKRLLATALRRAMDLGEKVVGPEELECAFTDEIWWTGTGPLNPFNPGFVFRRLDRGGEPFERASPRGRK